MDKKKRLDTKIFRLFKRAGHPRWFHHMGPKKFETWILCLGLIVKQVYRLSYRRVMSFLDEFFKINLPLDYSTKIQKKSSFRHMADFA